MDARSRVSRRAACQALSAGLAGLGGVSGGLSARPVRAANEKLQVACVGVGGIADLDVTRIASHPAVQIVGLCDVDANRFAKADAKLPGVRHFADYREMFAALGAGFDAVIVDTPDHMHAPVTVAALAARKHVYCQKPISHTVWEARQMRLWAEHAGVTTQMGTQIHSSAEYRLGVRLLRDGAIGKVQAVHSWAGVGGNDRTRLFAPPAAAPVPRHVAWDLWIGAAPMRDYAPAYHPYAWRDWQDFGGGALGDFGCHILDPVFTALELGAPLTVKARNSGVNDQVWPTQQTVDYVFPGTAHTAGETLPVTWTDGGLKPRHSLARMPGDADLPSAGSLFIGEQGCLVLPHVGRPRLYPVERYAGFVMPEVAARDHWHDWVDACLSGGTTTAGFHHAGPLTEAVHLGNIATRLWRPGLDPVSGRLDERAPVLEWDTATLRFRNSPAADRLVTKAYRPGFEVPAGPPAAGGSPPG
jgi:predicted dehydrogenase